MQNCGYLLKKHAELLVIFWGKCGKTAKKNKGYAKVVTLRFEEVSLHCRNMDIFHQFCRIMGSNFSDMGGIMGHKFEPKWHVPV